MPKAQRQIKFRFVPITIRLALLGVLLSGSTVTAQISPGDLASSHAFLDGIKNCVKCHELGKGPSEKNCMTCHKEIQTRVDQKKGYHHQVVTLDKKACFGCHAEHAGRNFDLIHWDNGQDKFDHKQTGYLLLGKHSTITCRDCHKSSLIKTDLKALQPKIDLNRTFLGLGTDCMACHFDEHRRQLAKDCQKCHNQDRWKPATKFNHDRAKFVLTGKHKVVSCEKCHPTVRDQRPPDNNHRFYRKYVGLHFQNCTACHKDVHKGKFGQNCEKCHTTSTWLVNKTTFDHSKTRFPLLGKHATVSCEKCHTNGDLLKPLKFASCNDCHKDVHQGKFGRDCASCHVPEGWKIINRSTFDHRKTGYPLLGMHATTKCEKCHVGGDFKLPLKFAHCSDCHKDAHQGQFTHRLDGGLCESCHNENGFIPATFTLADHAKTKFSLTDSHMAVPCIGCHKMKASNTGQEIRNFIFGSTRCEACHKDIHYGQFAKIRPVKSCDRCHKATEWSLLMFDHNRDSRFPLAGAHMKVNCAGCHKRVRFEQNIFVLYRPIDPSCKTCHSEGGLKLK